MTAQEPREVVEPKAEGKLKAEEEDTVWLILKAVGKFKDETTREQAKSELRSIFDRLQNGEGLKEVAKMFVKTFGNGKVEHLKPYQLETKKFFEEELAKRGVTFHNGSKGVAAGDIVCDKNGGIYEVARVEGNNVVLLSDDGVEMSPVSKRRINIYAHFDNGNPRLFGTDDEHAVTPPEGGKGTPPVDGGNSDKPGAKYSVRDGERPTPKAIDGVTGKTIDDIAKKLGVNPHCRQFLLQL